MPGKLGKIGTRVNLALSSTSCEAGITFVQVDEVDVRTEIEFFSPEFAHTKNDECNRALFSGLFIFNKGRAVVPLHSCPSIFVRNLDRGISQRAQIVRRLFKGSMSQQVSRSNPQIFTVAVGSKPS